MTLRIALISPKGDLYRHRGGIWKRSLRYMPLTLPTLAALVPPELDAEIDCLDEGIADADVVIMLRLQQERMQSALLPSGHEYFHTYGLTPRRLRHARRDAIVMHPGPINRGVEIDSAVADGAQSVILQQVTHGIAVRMAVMSMVLGSHAPPP